MRSFSAGSINTTPPNVILALTPEPDNNDLYSVSNSSSPTTSEESPAASTFNEKIRWSCHKDILKAKSNYFKSIFNSQFQEAEASIVFLPHGIFSASVLDAVLYYMYTNSLSIEDDEDINNLELLQSLYLAADYLGMESLCTTIEQHITIHLTHGFNCYCENCTMIVPLLLSFTGPNQQDDPRLSRMTRAILKLLIQDPERSLPTFWSSRSMVILLTQNPEIDSSLHDYLENGLLGHVNKHNAIESLYGCFLAEKQINKNRQEFQTDLLEMTLKKVVEAGSSLLADDFIFYCTKYPKLLSCVDGVTYSFDFLNYVISIVIDHQMNETNACSLYKGIMKHLMCRDTVQHTPLVKAMLQSAKNRIVQYISTNIVAVKKLNLIDKNIIDLLAHDLSVSPSALTDQEDLKRKQSNITNIPESKKKPRQHLLDWNIKLIRARFSCFFFNQHFKVGQRVQLLNRPVMTTGTIAFAGKIGMKEDNKKQTEYRLGIQLDRTVGTNDGSINGKRYFTTSSNRGVFVKPSDVILL